MKTITLLLTSFVLAGSSFAGTVAYDKHVTPTQIETPCFGPGFDLGIFGGAFLPRHKSEGYDNSAGGGVLGEYFFNEHLGFQVSYGAFATRSVQHLINGDIIVRFPIQSACVAPYLMLGGGLQLDGSRLGEYHAGVGVECKFKSNRNLSIFADGGYYWHKSGERERDFTLVRLGVKFGL